MLIGELVRITGFSRDTIRYYETRGLIEIPLRRDNLYKEYPEAAVNRLLFVKEMQGVGFTLRQIGDFIELFDSGEASCANTGPRVYEHMRSIDEKITQLETMRARLEKTFSSCAGNSPESPCSPIVAPLMATRA